MMLYIHLPFCKQKCKYCAFCSGTYSVAVQERYVDRLIAFLRYHLCQKGKEVTTVYIGGGTPSVLPLYLWRRLLEALNSLVIVKELWEFTVEINPESTNAELLALLKEGGVSRLSFGVQSLVDDELVRIGRLHTAESALAALRLGRKYFFDISADLIYGLPGQTPKSFRYSLSTLLAEDISHLSCYNLQLEEGTALYREAANLSFPDEDAQMEMYDDLIALTRQAGFRHYEISNFCKPDKQARHNSGYWDGTDYLGLGAAAHSKLGNKRMSFADDVTAFINKEDFSFDEQTDITEQDKRIEEIMLSLRTDRGVRLSLIDEDGARRFVEMGLGEIGNGRFTLNEQGFLLSNTIISELI